MGDQVWPRNGRKSAGPARAAGLGRITHDSGQLGQLLEATSEDKALEAASNVAASKEATAKQAASNEKASKKATSKAAPKEAASKGATSKEVTSKEAASAVCNEHN